jgi:endonuclease/exonuclease/phosphatase family metal-dependent hydrolase
LANTEPVPVIVEFAAIAAPALKTTVPSAFATGVRIDRVFVSALSELRVQVETPDPFEAEQLP